MNLLSVFGGGLWIIPLGLFIGAVYSGYRAFIQWKSGSGGWEKVNGKDKWVESDERVAPLSIGATWFAIILLVAAIGSFIWMHIEK